VSKIKICGLSRPADIEAVNKELPDYIGFVFAKSRRQVDEEMARHLKALLNPKIEAVGVFVNEDINRIIRLCREKVIDIVQLHGDEDENYIKELKSKISAPIMRAVRVKSAEDVKKASEISCDYLLFDTYTEKEYGGSGIVFDWSMITDINKPYFLAGGINIDNVLSAIDKCNPYCIDVSSGVETEGLKDPFKINEIVTKIRSVR